jgi:hypothetical protein
MSLSAVTVEALRKHLGSSGGAPRQLPFAELGASGHRDTARKMEEILDEERAQDDIRDRDR